MLQRWKIVNFFHFFFGGLRQKIDKNALRNYSRNIGSSNNRIFYLKIALNPDEY